MQQALITDALAALAGAWVLWNLVLPASRRRRPRPARTPRNDAGGGSLDQPVTVRVHTGKRA